MGRLWIIDDDVAFVLQLASQVRSLHVSEFLGVLRDLEWWVPVFKPVIEIKRVDWFGPVYLHLPVDGTDVTPRVWFDVLLGATGRDERAEEVAVSVAFFGHHSMEVQRIMLFDVEGIAFF